MKHLVTSSALALALAALLASCGGRSTGPASVGNAAAATGDVPVTAGIHACQFVVDGEAYGPHRCDVVPGPLTQLDKRSGWEFTGTLAGVGGAIRLTGETGCSYEPDGCRQAFSVDLRHDGATWRGPVVTDAVDPAWFLKGSSFELTDEAGYGGTPYGGATYGD